MWFTRQLCLVGAIFCLTQLVGVQEERRSLEEDIAEIVEPYLESIPAAQVGLLYRGRQYHFGYGDAFGNGVAPNRHTLFEIGSITKPMMGILIAKLVLENQLSIEDEANRYLPQDLQLPAYLGEPIRIKHLLTHTSALPREVKSDIDFVLDELFGVELNTRNSVGDFLRSHRLRRAPGSEFEYSNLGAGLMGFIAQTLTYDRWDKAVIEKVLRPLGMFDTAVVLSPQQQRRKALGYDWKMASSFENSFPIEDALSAAGSMITSSSELLKLAEALMKAMNSSVDSPLKESVKLLYGQANEQTGYFWGIDTEKRLVGHGGATYRFTADFVVNARQKYAIALLLNRFDLKINQIIGKDQLTVVKLSREIEKRLQERLSQ